MVFFPSPLTKSQFRRLHFSLKGGDPATRSRIATLLRLHPSHRFCLRQLPPIAGLAHRLRAPSTPMA